MVFLTAGFPEERLRNGSTQSVYPGIGIDEG
jgi:hypothetical protein